MRSIFFSLTLAGLCSGALAQSDVPMTAEQFDRYVTGRTYLYGREGVEPYGIEAYLPNRQVVWAYFNDECVEAYWYENDRGEICFVYPFDPQDKCWVFYKNGDVLRAVFVSDPVPLEYVVTQTGQSMPCQAPFLGA